MRRVLLLALLVGCGACAKAAPKADLLLVGGRVYTLSWPDPDGSGRPAATAPHGADGWAPDADTIAISGEALTIEEAVRGRTAWAAYADFTDTDAGTIAVGKFANLTVFDIDPFQLAEKDPARLLAGRMVMTFLKGVRSVPPR